MSFMYLLALINPEGSSLQSVLLSLRFR